jgi:hypothetical protein
MMINHILELEIYVRFQFSRVSKKTVRLIPHYYSSKFDNSNILHTIYLF